MENKIEAEIQNKASQYELVIIGSGPAGLAAGIYAARAALRFVIVERSAISGGQVLNTYEVDNYPGIPNVSGMQLSERFREHCETVGAQFVHAEATEIEKTDAGDFCVRLVSGESLDTKTVLYAAGASPRLLGVKGETELAGMGVSYCATCDGAFFKNRTVAVVGGGDVAVEDAIFLARLCKKVYLIHRRDTFRAAAVLVERALSLEAIEPVYDSTVEEICGTEFVEKLRVRNQKSGEETMLEVDGVFIAVGNRPETEAVRSLARQCGEAALLNPAGFVNAGETGETAIAGFFAAGDIRTKALRQILTAAADGANAIAAIERYLAATEKERRTT